MDEYTIFIARVFVPAWPLQPNLMFLSMVPSGAPFRVGYWLLQENIRRGCKGFPWMYTQFFASMFVPAWPLQLSLMFSNKVISPSQVEHLLGWATGFYWKTLDKAVKALSNVFE